MPMRANASGCLSGHSTASLSACFTSSLPPMSLHRTLGTSTSTSRNALGRTTFNAACRSAAATDGAPSTLPGAVAAWAPAVSSAPAPAPAPAPAATVASPTAGAGAAGAAPADSELVRASAPRRRFAARPSANRAASAHRAARSAPTKPWVTLATFAKSAWVMQCGYLQRHTRRPSIRASQRAPQYQHEHSKQHAYRRMVTVRMCRRPASDGMPISTSRSSRPGRRRAGSSALGRLVAASTTCVDAMCPHTRVSHCTSITRLERGVTSDATRTTGADRADSDAPSIAASSVATTREPTSPDTPVESRAGHTASTSSMKMTAGAAALAAENTSRMRCSDSPTYLRQRRVRHCAGPRTHQHGARTLT